MIDQYNAHLPVGTAYRYRFDLNDVTKSRVPIRVEPELLITGDDDEEWQNYMNAGQDFPVIDWDNSLGLPYDHFWAGGFGTIMPDRFLRKI
mgnify:CR=1 FL=1